MHKINEVKLMDLIPVNLKKDKDLIAATESVDKVFFDMINKINSILILPNISNLSEELLDSLAFELHVDFYDTNLERNKKISLIRNSIKWHRQKGTAGAVQELIETVFGDGEVVEWFEYDGKPFFFKVVSSNAQITSTKVNEFTRALESVKNVRSHLEKVEISISEKCENYVGFVLQTAETLTIRQV